MQSVIRSCQRRPATLQRFKQADAVAVIILVNLLYLLAIYDRYQKHAIERVAGSHERVYIYSIGSGLVSLAALVPTASGIPALIITVQLPQAVHHRGEN